MYRNGVGVPRDFRDAEAERLFRKAAELGNKDANNNLSMIASWQPSRL